MLMRNNKSSLPGFTMLLHMTNEKSNWCVQKQRYEETQKIHMSSVWACMVHNELYTILTWHILKS